jgi:uncharacterized protein (DUF2344 family)
MPTFRTSVVFDFEVPEGTDADEFHDVLRDALEQDIGVINAFGIQDAAVDADFAADKVILETVRDIDVTELED